MSKNELIDDLTINESYTDPKNNLTYKTNNFSFGLNWKKVENYNAYNDNNVRKSSEEYTRVEIHNLNVNAKNYIRDFQSNIKPERIMIHPTYTTLNVENLVSRSFLYNYAYESNTTILKLTNKVKNICQLDKMFLFSTPFEIPNSVETIGISPEELNIEMPPSIYYSKGTENLVFKESRFNIKEFVIPQSVNKIGHESLSFVYTESANSNYNIGYEYNNPNHGTLKIPKKFKNTDIFANQNGKKIDVNEYSKIYNWDVVFY